MYAKVFGLCNIILENANANALEKRKEKCPR